MLKFVPALFALGLASYASAATVDGEYHVKQKLAQASQEAFSVVGETQAKISYIKAGGETGPVAGCEFCTDDAVEENDGDVLNHLDRISQRANEIGSLALQASQQSGSALQYYAQRACDLTRSTLDGIPAARATIAWAPVGIARPDTFDSTERKLHRVKGLLPSCF